MLSRCAVVILCTLSFMLVGMMKPPDAASAGAQEKCPTTTSQQNLNIVWRYILALSQGDYETVEALLHDDLSHTLGRSGIVVKNEPGNEDEILMAKGAGAVKFKVHDAFAADDKVAVRFSYDIQSDVVPGGKKGTTVRVGAIVIARIECGMIKDTWHEHDVLGMLLGAGVKFP